MMKELRTAIRAIIVFTIMLGLIYPLAVTVFAQIFFKSQANGSLIVNQDGKIAGSVLIGQSFSSPEYFHPRSSFAGTGYDAIQSSGSCLGPTNKKLVEAVAENLSKVLKENPGVKAKDVPVDAVTASASGLDPHISPEYAELQIPRVAKARSMDVSEVRALVDKYTDGRQIGFLGEPRVNVLLLNLELDRIKKVSNRR
ncbi:MAG: potassium-transporting ATPase subunit KdpC [Firmicutes bacterium]|nr:potassium-transporting ATPase subunit KdpC [Bacillota bacterium]